MLAAVILSAGESSRMGSPKALLPFRGHTFLEHLLRVVQDAARQPAAAGAAIGCVRVVLGAHADQVREQCALDPASVVVNAQWKQGQLSSIQSAIRNLQAGESDGMMLFLVDHPLVSAALVADLAREFYRTRASIVAPTFRGKRGHPVIFARGLYSELLAAPPEQGARAVVWAHAAEVVEVATEEEGVVLNLNDPETLRRALEARR
jgi:molybdenum cofactor cytidylyltransferase